MIKELMAGLVLVQRLPAVTPKRGTASFNVDSLRSALAESKQVEATVNKVGVLLDSIDADRKALNTNMVEARCTQPILHV